MTNESVIIKDDIISPAYQDLVATAVDNYDAAWYLGGDQDEYQGWATHYLKDDQILNNTYFLLVPILLEAVHKALDSKVSKIIRMRGGLFCRNQNEGEHTKHVDFEYPHHTMLYYPIDSDGVTTIEPDAGEEIKIEPKKGRCVIFPGLFQHCSSSPKDHSKRIVINYNFQI